MLQCVAMHCSVSHGALCCSVPQHVAVCCSVLQHHARETMLNRAEGGEKMAPAVLYHVGLTSFALPVCVCVCV